MHLNKKIKKQVTIKAVKDNIRHGWSSHKIYMLMELRGEG